MTASDKFRLGDRVQFSVMSNEQFSTRRAGRAGIVVGFGRESHLVVIVVDGLKTRASWHMDFWERIEEPESASGSGGRPSQ